MKIVLEGCDGVGKTSVAKILAMKYGCDIVHMTGDDPKDYNFYNQSLRKENVIYDRNVIGERVYPLVFNREPELKRYELDLILESHTDVHFFVLTANADEIERRLKNRGNENENILKSLGYINAKFKTLAYEYGIHEIDTTHARIEDVALRIINIIEKEKRHD